MGYATAGGRSSYCHCSLLSAIEGAIRDIHLPRPWSLVQGEVRPKSLPGEGCPKHGALTPPHPGVPVSKGLWARLLSTSPPFLLKIFSFKYWLGQKTSLSVLLDYGTVPGDGMHTFPSLWEGLWALCQKNPTGEGRLRATLTPWGGPLCSAAYSHAPGSWEAGLHLPLLGGSLTWVSYTLETRHSGTIWRALPPLADLWS